MDNPFLTALYPCRLTEMQNHSDNKLCTINIMPICHMCSSSAIRKNILDKNRTILHCYFLFVSNVLYFIFVSVAEKRCYFEHLENTSVLAKNQKTNGTLCLFCEIAQTLSTAYTHFYYYISVEKTYILSPTPINH